MHEAKPGPRIVRLKEACERLGGVSEMYIRRKQGLPGFPRFFKIDPTSGVRGAVGCLDSELNGYIASLASRSEQAAA
jgi:hypothetical protein